MISEMIHAARSMMSAASAPARTAPRPSFTALTAAICLLGGFLLLLPAPAFAHGMAESDRQAMLEGGYRLYAFLGAKHMVTGYDHLLFLFGVMFFLTKFGEIVRFITAFTLGHCITLIGATFFKISANYFLIDAVIALTVCYKGFDNLDGFRRFLKVRPPNLLFLVFIFGLVHGFGLSARVQTLPLGEGMPFILRLLAFNVGVEAGQILALSVMLLFLSVWRHTATFAKFSAAANTLLILAGGGLFLMQMHGYSHTTDPDAFGFPKDNHSHVHAEMYEASLPDRAPAAVGLGAFDSALPSAPSSTPADGPADPPADAPGPDGPGESAPSMDTAERTWSRPSPAHSHSHDPSSPPHSH